MARADEWRAECMCYESTGRALTGRKTPIQEIPVSEGELGYTSSDWVIHLARRHALMAGLTDEEKRFFRMGIFAHELLHLLLTDFQYLEQVLREYTWDAKCAVIALFANLVEDPAIEYWSDTQIGGSLYAALWFTILRIYENSCEIQDAKTPFTQLTTALVQFGDMGLLKGHFTSERAREAFRAIAPEFNAAIESEDPHVRVDCAVRWAEMTQDMWATETESEENSMLEEIKRFMEDNGISETNGGNNAPVSPSRDGEEEKRPSGKRRDDLAKQIEESKGQDDAGAGDGTNTEPGDGTAQGSTSASTDEAKSNEEAAEDAAGKTGQETNENGADILPNLVSGIPDPWENTPEEQMEKALRQEDTAIDRKAVNDLSQSIQTVAERMDIRKKWENLNFKVESRFYKSVKCKDNQVQIKPSERNAYVNEHNRIMEARGKDIRLLTASLSKIFMEDTGEIRRALRGKYNVTRASKQSTAKIFDRRVEPKQIDSLAIMLLIDESGSMCGLKTQMARETATVLAEAFSRLKIPCYIMGFTTGGNYDAVHNHYVTWHNTPEERIALAGINAYSANFDAYAIRTGGNILRKKRAEHKIMIVVSDGYPSCQIYRSTEDAIADTAAAVRETETYATVLAIGIGDCSPEILRHIYKGSFVHAEKPEDLSTVLTKHLRNIIRNFK